MASSFGRGFDSRQFHEQREGNLAGGEVYPDERSDIGDSRQFHIKKIICLNFADFWEL